jgi:hypothetical protein
MPAAVEMPAPVNTTSFAASRICSGMSMIAGHAGEIRTRLEG